MIVIALFLIILGAAGTAWATWGALTRQRPFDILFALLAPVALLIGLTGGVLIFVPGFFRQ